MTQPMRLGGRGSELSRVQAELARNALAAIEIDCEFIPITTQGDRDRVSSLREIGGQGVFVRAVESALLAGEIDIAVHSAKDVPPVIAEGTALAAYLPRGDVRDALVSRGGVGLSGLPPGSAVGTGSRRRAAQTLRRRPDLRVIDIRGNVDTRIARVQEEQEDQKGICDAVIVAAAALQRLRRSASALLPIDLMMPAPGQAALVLQCRAADAAHIERIDHRPTSLAVKAERAMLGALGAGCSLPLAALAGVRGGEVVLAGRLLSADGSQLVELQRSGGDPETVGEAVAVALLDRGGRALMEQEGA